MTFSSKKQALALILLCIICIGFTLCYCFIPVTYESLAVSVGDGRVVVEDRMQQLRSVDVAENIFAVGDIVSVTEQNGRILNVALAE